MRFRCVPAGRNFPMARIGPGCPPPDWIRREVRIFDPIVSGGAEVQGVLGGKWLIIRVILLDKVCERSKPPQANQLTQSRQAGRHLSRRDRKRRCKSMEPRRRRRRAVLPPAKRKLPTRAETARLS
jgi:hypothetical protein